MCRRRASLPRRARKIPRGGAERRAAHRRLHPGGAAVFRRRPKAPTSLTSTSARPPAGRQDAKAAGPKMAALIAAAAEPAPEIPFVSFESEGVILIYGRDEQAIEAAQPAQGSSRRHRADQAARRVAPPRVDRISRWCKGTIRSAKGHLGAFELMVDDYAQPAPSSRGALGFGAARNGAVSRCDLVLDLSGGAPLFHRGRSARRISARRSRRSGRRAHGRAQGARPRRQLRQAALHRLHRGPVRAFALAASSAATAASISARRARSCRPATTSRSIAHICAGCGQCAAVCPTGAASYALPPADTLMRKLRALLTAYREGRTIRSCSSTTTRTARR